MHTEHQPTEPLLATLQAARRVLTEETRSGRGGRRAVEQSSLQLDAILTRAFDAARRPAQSVALVALGGYGRRHLCLHSDVDLLVLFGGRIGPDEERFVRELLTALWDLQLVLGHQVRELADFDELEIDNPEFLLALVDARPVAGERSIVERLMAPWTRCRPGTRCARCSPS